MQYLQAAMVVTLICVWFALNQLQIIKNFVNQDSKQTSIAAYEQLVQHILTGNESVLKILAWTRS